MKVCLVAHGYPPELVGGTEMAVQGLARGLARRGHEVLVVAGSMQFEGGFRTSVAEDRDPGGGSPVRVVRIHRADLYFDHWQKSASARVSEAFARILAEEAPDVVHVHHWIRLSRDLVQTAARAAVPAVVTLHDLWSTCLIAFRVQPGTEVLCEAPLAPSPCLSCAGSVPPHTPWVSAENQHLAFAQRKGDLLRELGLARAVVVPSRTHAETVSRFLGVDAQALALEVVPHGRDLGFRPPEPLPPPAQHGKLVLGAWGHLHPLKGTDLLIAAVSRLGPGVELHLAGGEPDASFAARVRGAAAGLDVHFHGPFVADELDRHPVARVHAMVSGTRAAESWGLVVDEAAHLRLPMVLPRSGAFVERVGEGVLFFEPRDVDSLCAVLARLRDEVGLLEQLRRVLPPAQLIAPPMEQHVAVLAALYERVVRAGAPPVGPPDWWASKMQNRAEEAWDESLSRASAEELGLA